MGFSNYAKQGPRAGKTVAFTLIGLVNPDGSSPMLHVEYIGESNRPFWLEALAKASAKVKAGFHPQSNPTEIDRARRADREDNRETLITHSARKVENAFHDDGTAATEKDIRAIVMALPDEDFDRLWMFVQNPDNYRSFTIAEEPTALAEK
jgi:hypothetical protein